MEKREPLSKDTLALLGVGVIIVGIVLLSYGFVPFQQNDYKVVASGTVPAVNPNTNETITSDEAPVYFMSTYTGTQPIDKVQCAFATGGYFCDGLQFTGTSTVYSTPARYYGLGTLALGAVALYVARRFAPIKDSTVHLRPIKIRIDEDICVSNGVCIAIAPTVFQFRAQSSPTIFAPMVYVFDPSGADNDTIILAARMCPTNAIVIEDAETGEQIHPLPHPLSKKEAEEQQKI